MKTIVFDVSSHGLGHLAQTGCVVTALRARRPDTRLIVRSAHPAERVAEFCGAGIEVQPLPFEPTLVMRGPLTVDRAASASAFREFHALWEENVARRAENLGALRPDLLVSNVAYASLAAAARLSITAVALCSLNWLELRRAFCVDDDAIAGKIEEAYQSAAVFLQPAPSIPTTYLRNARAIGPIGRRGARRDRELRRLLGLETRQRVLLATFGGIPGAPPLMPTDDPALFWIHQSESGVFGCNATEARMLPMPFIDILASVDAVVSKDGYATVVESACNGVRLLMLARPDWPETPHFIEWASRRARFVAIPHDCDAALARAALLDLLAQDRAPAIEPTGVSEAADEIERIANLA